MIGLSYLELKLRCISLLFTFAGEGDTVLNTRKQYKI